MDQATVRRAIAVAALAFVLPITAACNPSPSVKIGSKNFAESALIAEMYAQLLEAGGMKVERKFNTGPTDVAHKALTGGEIDLYPEYTGTALVDVLGQPVITDSQKTFDTVAAAYTDKFKLIWLDRAPANNTQAIGLGKGAATRLGLSTLSSFVAKANEMAAKGTPLRLAGPPEFETRADGMPGLKKAYGDLKVTFIPTPADLRYRRLLDGDADLVVAFGTDGEVGGYEVALLVDDKHIYPPYNVAPVVREQALADNPKIRQALNTLAPRLNAFTVRNLNFEVTNKKRPAADVAREFLIAEGLLK